MEDKNRLIIAPDYPQIDGPLIFLAGPIQGAYDWQSGAASLIHGMAPQMYVASPRRNLPGSKDNGDFGQQMYNEQVDWETHHLRLAGERGCVMFWLAHEYEHRCDRAYAQTTRFELAEWKMRHEYEGANLVIGIEEGFTNARYIRRRFSQDCPDIKIASSLEDTCRIAIALARSG